MQRNALSHVDFANIPELIPAKPSPGSGSNNPPPPTITPVSSPAAGHESNRIVVSAWANVTGYNVTKIILLSSAKTKIIVSLGKEAGQDFRLRVRKILPKDVESLANRHSMFTFSFYTLDPQGLEEKFRSVAHCISESISEEDADRSLVTAAWEFFEVCGIYKLVRIHLTPEQRYFPAMPDYPNIHGVPKLDASRLDTLGRFGGRHYGFFASEKSVLATAKNEDRKLIDLRVGGETEISKVSCMRAMRG